MEGPGLLHWAAIGSQASHSQRQRAQDLQGSFRLEMCQAGVLGVTSVTHYSRRNYLPGGDQGQGGNHQSHTPTVTCPDLRKSQFGRTGTGLSLFFSLTGQMSGEEALTQTLLRTLPRLSPGALDSHHSHTGLFWLQENNRSSPGREELVEPVLELLLSSG